jgi:hypothetical protein
MVQEVYDQLMNAHSVFTWLKSHNHAFIRTYQFLLLKPEPKPHKYVLIFDKQTSREKTKQKRLSFATSIKFLAVNVWIRTTRIRTNMKHCMKHMALYNVQYSMCQACVQ